MALPRKKAPTKPATPKPKAKSKSKTTPPMKFRSSTMQMPSLQTMGLQQPPIQGARKLNLPGMGAGLPKPPALPQAPAAPALPTLPSLGGLGGGDRKKRKRS